MDDPLLMGMLDRTADVDEDPQSLLRREVVLVAVLRDRDAPHVIHHEVGPAALGRPGVEDLGDVRVVHQGQRLPLGLEARDHLLGVHAQLDDLQGHLAADRLLLLGHVDVAEAAFADLLQELVGADQRADVFFDRADVFTGAARLRPSEKAARISVCLQQSLHMPSQVGVAAAGGVQIVGPIFGCLLIQRLTENRAEI